MQPRLVIAHHLNPVQAGALRAALPDDAELHSLLGAAPWVLPEGVHVIVTQPADMISADFRHPSVPPAGWPGAVQWVHLRSTGTDRYPPWVLTAPVVTTASGAQAIAISEYVFGAMLRHEKRQTEIAVSNAAMWLATRARIGDSPLGGLEGKTLGLVGFGNIGRQVAAKAGAFGMKILAARKSTQAGPTVEGVDILPLSSVVRQADHLVIAVPLDDATRGLIDFELLRKARKGMHLVNVARGAVVDTPGLLRALNEGYVAAATLDVTDPEPLPDGHPLYSHPSVMLTPHVAYSGASTERHGNRLFCENLARFVRGEALHQRLVGKAVPVGAST